MIMTSGKLSTLVNKLKLKVKAKSLAAESVIIKQEEKRLSKLIKQYPDLQDSWSRHALYLHRVIDVRKESRATHLARAFMNRKPYKSVEPTRKDEKEIEFLHVIVPRVFQIIKKYDKDAWAECACSVDDTVPYVERNEATNKLLSDRLSKWLDI